MRKKLSETNDKPTRYAQIRGLPDKNGNIQPYPLRRSLSCPLISISVGARSDHTRKTLKNISDTQDSIQDGFKRMNTLFSRIDPSKLSRNAAGFFGLGTRASRLNNELYRLNRSSNILKKL